MEGQVLDDKAVPKNDIPTQVIKRFSGFLCKPISELINDCIVEDVWPDSLKIESVTPVPKVPNPKSANDLRKIAGLPNLSKFMEKIIVKYDQMESFQIFDQCFPTKKRTIFSENQPFFSEKLEKLKRQKCREFSKNRKSKKILGIQNIYRKKLLDAKKAYYRKRIHALRSSNPKAWYKNIKHLVGEDSSDKRVDVEDIKDFSDEEQCEMIADKFAEVSYRYEPLRRDKIIFPAFSKEDVPVISEGNVLNVLKVLDVSKSTRKSDIPAKILKIFSSKICKPLTKIVNNCICQGFWPELFKTEIVTPVPKVPVPKTKDDLRKISGSMNLNKVMEKIVCPLIVEDMRI